MPAGREKAEPESWTSKLLFIAAFLATACGTYFLSLPLHDRVTVDYPALDNFFVQVLVGLVFVAPVFAIEDKLLRRLNKRDVFLSIRPVTIGLFVGYVLPYGLVA